MEGYPPSTLLNEQITCIDGGAILSALIIGVKVYVCLCDGARRNNARPRQTRKLEHSQISDIDDNGIKKCNMSSMHEQETPKLIALG